LNLILQIKQGYLPSLNNQGSLIKAEREKRMLEEGNKKYDSDFVTIQGDSKGEV